MIHGKVCTFYGNRAYTAFAESGRKTSILFHLLLIETLLSSMDSDLEAFSHNPTDGSFTALAFQLTVFTNYLIQRFLSY